jgi:dipeptidyl aminopeptidase/acylaminoacyl peptidase
MQASSKRSGRALLAGVIWIATCAFAQPAQMDQVLSQLQQVCTYSDVSISPDGRWVTWVQSAGGRPGGEIYLFDRQHREQQPRRITAGSGQSAFREGGIAWSSDSSKLAFLSNADNEQQPQVYITSPQAGTPRKLTDLHGYVTDVRWAPDGKRLAFLYAENGGGGGPLLAAPAQTGVIGSEIHNQRITIADIATGELRQITPPDLNIYEYDWSPDGTKFVATAAPGPADNNWWIAQLYVVDAGSGAMRVLYHPPIDRQLAVPRWSPDGNTIAFIGGLMSDEGFNGGDLFVLPASGGEPRDLTSQLKATPTGFTWHGQDLIFTEDIDGASAIALLDTQTGEIRQLWKGDENVHESGNYANFSLAADGDTGALVQSSWRQPPEIWAGRIGRWQQITHANDAQQPRWGKAESLIWNNEGFRVQGWLLYPANYDPSRRYPMVVEIHGGPANIRMPAWPSPRFDMSVLSSLGYFVFFPNARGSYGEGEAFTRANIKDFGSGDLRDVLAGVDAVLKRVPVDPNRLGVTGWSYGGYMTMWTVTQTHRFRAAVAGAGIANWLSYYGENLIDKWMLPYFGASVYDDPAVYAKSSPIHFIKNVKTPTLILVGERDAECPAPQSFEFWHALMTLGVPTQLVVYPGEGHSFQKPEDRSDVMHRAVEWFSKYLGTAGSDSEK